MKEKIVKILRIFIILIVSTELLFFGNLQITIADIPIPQSETELNIKGQKIDISERTIFELVNEQRKKNNISPLIINQKLVQAANNKADDLLKNKYFGHDSVDGKKTFSTWIKETGYQYSFVGENLASNFKNNTSIIKAWLNSLSHKENLLNKNFTETGIAVKNNGKIIVQIFGRPMNNPIPLEETIGSHISEILILYINLDNALKESLNKTNNLV